MTELERLVEFRQLERRISHQILHSYLTALLSTAYTATPLPASQEKVF